MKIAKLRVCASCEWIFKRTEFVECPQCGFAHYGARMVYGDQCYRLAKTQAPWKEKKLFEYECKLNKIIKQGNSGLDNNQKINDDSESLTDR